MAQRSAIVSLVGIFIVASLVRCQVIDGDEQFQYHHQDIGRISASSAPVAPQTIVRQQVVTSEPIVAAVAAPVVVPTPRAVHLHQNPKRNRITLAVRRDPNEHQLEAPAAPIVASYSPVQQYQSSQLVAPAANAYQPQIDEAQVASAAPVFRPSSATSTVTARQAALVAQVAAERQAEIASHSPEAPSLGSPIEALSVPAVAQVQAPPTLIKQHQAAASLAAPAYNFVNQPEEPIVAPSFEQVLGQGCPHRGVFSYENKDHCDRYYMCTNGTFTEEACPNGLAYSQMGAVYQHCAYNWNVDCGRKKVAEPISSPGCPWQFGIFPIAAAGRCSIDYFACEWGIPETKRCSPEGLFYDDRIKGCQWADQLGCKSEALLNFKCPAEDEDNPYWPYPRYYHTNRDIIVCVNEQPRLVHCNEDQLVDASSLACVDLKKKIKKNF